MAFMRPCTMGAGSLQHGGLSRSRARARCDAWHSWAATWGSDYCSCLRHMHMQDPGAQSRSTLRPLHTITFLGGQEVRGAESMPLHMAGQLRTAAVQAQGRTCGGRLAHCLNAGQLSSIWDQPVLQLLRTQALRAPPLL